MTKLFLKFVFALTIVGAIISTTSSCKPGTDPDGEKDTLGWFGMEGDNAEDLDNINDDIYLGDGNGTLPTSVDLFTNFPPIGNQGQYGTCVAWAAGYNHRSFLNAKAKGITPNSSSQQFSPKYLFWQIPNSKKGDDCGGTGFEAAYDIMQSDGIATLDKVPYTGLGDCSNTPPSANASDYKILNFRQIDLNVATIKENLANGKAVVFGAKLGDEFMNANSSAVLSSQTYGYTGQHAYHAMILSGYDDNKSAFRVVNSWGTSWGDGGKLWVDQNFFANEFAFCAFVARSADDPDDGGDNVVDDPVAGKDLMAWELGDEDNGGGVKRKCLYNVFNSGTETIEKTSDWSILYLCYDAHNADNYTVILYDYYSDDYNPNNGEVTGDITEGNTGITPLSQVQYGNSWNYVDVLSGQTVSAAVYNITSGRFKWEYEMPTNINGEYYLVMIADGFDDIAEADEENNYYFLTNTNGDPINIVNGVIQDELSNYTPPAKSVGLPSLFAKSKSPTAINKDNLNAYTPEEIISLIKYQKSTGRLQQKAMQALRTNKSGNAGGKSFVLR